MLNAMIWPRADLAEHVLHRHLHVVEVDGGGGASLDPIFFSSAPLVTPPKRAFHQERGVTCSPPDLGEDREQVGRPPLVIHIFWPLRM
jgi:hypothetical protein